MATDGTRLYMAGRRPFNEQDSYVQAAIFNNLGNFNSYEAFQGETVEIFGFNFRVTDLVETPDPAELGLEGSEATQYRLARPRVTGLAVQVQGEYLFVAREQLNSLHILNKLTGTLEHVVSLTAPKHTRVDADGNLWVVHGDSEVLEKFNVNAADGTLIPSGQKIEGFSDIQAAALSPDGTTIAIADAGDFHQVFGYSTDTEQLLWTLGRTESYSTNAKVHNDKFLFRMSYDYPDEYSFLAYEDNGDLWVGDRGNSRYLKFDHNRQYLDQQMWLRAFYSCNVDPNNPNRVFSDYLEFSVDYGVPLVAGISNGAWQLANNWGAGVPPDNDNAFNRLENVTTLSNGRTYAFMQSATRGSQEFHIIELVENGIVRDTGVTVENRANATELKRDGTIRWVLGENGIQTFYQKPIVGFDAMHNPILGETTIWGSYPESENYVKQNGPQEVAGEFTANGNMVVFDGRLKTPGDFHLGSLRQGEDKLSFVTAVGVEHAFDDPYPHGTGYFDYRSNVQYAGNVALALDDWIVWGYNGEFWNNAQTNMWHMVHEDGLFLRDFGVASLDIISGINEGIAGMAGNAFAPAVVKVGDNAYLWHNDESYHAGVHRWKISNLSSIQKFMIDITPTEPSLTSAYSRIEAENFNSRFGTQVGDGDEGPFVGWINNGDYLGFSNIDFSNGVIGFQGRIASGNTGGIIEIRIDGATGTKIGDCTVANTGSWQNWDDVYCRTENLEGVHDVYLVFTQNDFNLFNINWFTFIEKPIFDSGFEVEKPGK